MKKPPFAAVFRGALAGKSISRILTNEAIRTKCAGLKGRVLDIAGGLAPSYLAYLPQEIALVRTDITASPGVVAVDMNAILPFPDNSFDAVMCFNALYIADDPAALSREVHRVLKSRASWYVASPFVANEMPEPHDYRRFTAEGLERLFKDAGFSSSVEINRIGERGSAAMALLSPFCVFNIVRAFAYPIALMFDSLVPAKVRREHPSPLGYFCIVRK